MKKFQDEKLASETENWKPPEEPQQKELPGKVFTRISAEIDKINSFTGT